MRQSTRRILLTLEYEGTAYSGWQRQLNGPSIQEELEKALHRATGEGIKVTGASRTDAGVHALGQRAHFDTASSIPENKWPLVLGSLLPPDIRVTSAVRVPEHFSARFDAKGKAYEYRIFNRRVHSALRRNFCAFYPLPLDEDAMARAAKSLVGRHDFAAFEAAGGSSKTTVRSIFESQLRREGEELVYRVYGDAFLYNMVRIIAGSLMAIGQGKLLESAFVQAIQSGNRLHLGPTAPACGLCLMQVDYQGLP